MVGLPLHTVYGPGWREHLLYYAADAAAEREWQREARRCAIAVLYGVLPPHPPQSPPVGWWCAVPAEGRPHRRHAAPK